MPAGENAADARKAVDLPDAERERLRAWLEHQGLLGAGAPLEILELSGGASNEVWLVRSGDRALVIRKPPREVPPGRNEGMLREYRLLYALRNTDVPHPRVLGVCEDPDVLGCCFYVMEHVDGWSCMERTGWPPPFDRDLQARRGLAWELVEGIARLAQVDWKAVGLENFGRPEGFHERQVDRWLSFMRQFSVRELSGLADAADFLRRYRPRYYRPGLIHGDYQFANVMFAHGAPARLVAIVDWEMATVGDPLLDLAWVLMSWPNPEDRSSGKWYVDYEGLPTREELMDYYARRTGFDLAEMDYYLVLARFKMAAVLEAGYARFLQGQAANPKMAFFGEVAREMAEKAGALARSTPLNARRSC
jgi:aminoglycoside phosphotransferase (APT) family kinase protein